MEYANKWGIFLDILDDLDRYAILEDIEGHPIISQKESAPQVTANNTLRMGYTRIEHLAGGAASVAALCNKTPI